MQFPTTSGGRTAGYRIGTDRSAGIPTSPDGSAPSHVVTRAAVEPDASAVLARDDAETVMLDLVQPRLAARDEAERQGDGAAAWPLAARAQQPERSAASLSS